MIIIKMIVILFSLILFLLSTVSFFRQYKNRQADKESQKKIKILKRIRELYKIITGILILTAANIFVIMTILNDKKNIITMGGFIMIVVFIIFAVKKVKK